MTTTYLNIELEEGIDQVITLPYTDKTTNLPIDITGYTSVLRVRESLGSIPVLLELTNTGISPTSNITIGGTSGIVSINFRNVTTTSFTSGVYDIILIDTAGTKIKLAKGFILITRTSSI